MTIKKKHVVCKHITPGKAKMVPNLNEVVKGPWNGIYYDDYFKKYKIKPFH